MDPPAPYPYAWLPRWSRREATQATVIARALQPVRRTATARTLLDARWDALLGGRLEAWPSTPGVLSRDELLARFGSESLVAVMHHAVLGTIAALMDAPFALTLAARALGSDGDDARRAGATRVFGPAQEGALAMLCAQAATLVCAPSPPPVVRGVTDRVLDVTAAIDATSFVTWPWRVSLGIDAGEITFVADVRAQFAAGANAPVTAAELGEACAPVALCIARARLAARDIAALAPGDVVLTDVRADALEHGLDAGECSVTLGEVEVPASWRAGVVTLHGAARTAGRAAMTTTGESAAHQSARDDGAVMSTERLAAVPVDVDVVIARTAVTLADVGAWRVGEVVAFPSRVGELAEVRAGGRVVARGELCDVDGQLGVRVTELL
ncbi:MAG: FliM/FliN family flagellar motor switch protein [Deltaproteobacteria bacterium]